MTQVKGIELVVDGRTFVQEPPTFEQEMEIMRMVVESGFDQPIETLGLDPKTNDLTRSTKLLIIHAYKSGVLFDLLGSLVTEKGQEWSPERSHEIGQLFKRTRDAKAKAQLHPALVAAITAFFLSANSLETTSPISSDETGVSLRPKESRPKTDPKIAEELFRSGIMPKSSERLPSTRKSRLRKSSAGRSAKG